MKGMTKMVAVASVIVMMLCGATVVFDSSDGEPDGETNLVEIIKKSTSDSTEAVTIELKAGKYSYSGGGNDIFKGEKLTIKPASGAEGKVVVELSGRSHIGVSNPTATKELLIKGIIFESTEDGEEVQLDVWTFYNYSFKDCTFNKVGLTRISGNATTDNTLGGTAVVSGCTFTTPPEKTKLAFAATLFGNNVVFENNNISEWSAGLLINTKGTDASVKITGNTLEDPLEHIHPGFQVDGNATVSLIHVENNTVKDVKWGLAIGSGVEPGDDADVLVKNNSFDDCEADITYVVDSNNKFSDIKVTFIGDRPPKVCSNNGKVDIGIDDVIDHIELNPEKPTTPPSYDDEDEFPFIPGQNTSSGNDDTTTYIAVAAAAAVVAVLAVLVMAMNKGKL